MINARSMRRDAEAALLSRSFDCDPGDDGPTETGLNKTLLGLGTFNIDNRCSQPIIDIPANQAARPIEHKPAVRKIFRVDGQRFLQLCFWRDTHQRITEERRCFQKWMFDRRRQHSEIERGRYGIRQHIRRIVGNDTWLEKRMRFDEFGQNRRQQVSRSRPIGTNQQRTGHFALKRFDHIDRPVELRHYPKRAFDEQRSRRGGAGAMYSFGVMIDLATPLAPTVAWGFAFGRLGLDGLAANYCAWQFGSLTR